MAPGVKNLPANAVYARGSGLIPGLGRSPGVGNDNPLQYSCLENSMYREAWKLKSPGGCKELDMCTGARTHTHTHTHTPAANWEVEVTI